MSRSIISIGPAFDLYGEATATVELEMDLSVGIHYQLDGLSFTVGTTTSSTPGFTPLDARKFLSQVIFICNMFAYKLRIAVKFSVDPSVTAKATLEAHLIPTVSSRCFRSQ